MSYIHVNFLTMVTPKETYLEATENDKNGKFHASPEQYICQKMHMQEKKAAILYTKNHKNCQSQN